MNWLFTPAGSLGIELETPVVYSGGTMQGSVIAMLNKDINATSCQISFQGEEWSHVTWDFCEDRCKGNHETEHNVRHFGDAKRQVVGIDVPLASFSAGKIPRGRYVWPFTAVLPAGLPSTMFASCGGSYCRVSYSLKARLARAGILQFDIKAGREVHVRSAPLPPTAVPVFVQPFTKEVKLCCFLNRGKVTLGAKVDSTLVGRGETISISMACKNDSTTEIEGIDCKLMETVTWSDGGSSKKLERPIAVAEFQALDAAGDKKPAKKEQELQALKEDVKQGGSGRAASCQELYNQLLRGQHRCRMTCAPDARDTYPGGVITTSHTILLTLTTGCCFTSPTVQLPVRVGTPPLPQPSHQPAVIAVPVGTAVPTMHFAHGPPTNSGGGGGLASRPANWDSGPPVVRGEVVALPMGSAVIGGLVSRAAGGGEDDVPVVVARPEVVTWLGLLGEMDRTLDDLSLLRAKAGDPMWSGMLGALAPDQYAAVVCRVKVEVDQPLVAVLLASKLSHGMTCAHLAAALQQSKESYRATMVDLTAPLCADLKKNAHLVTAQLSSWQLVITRARFEELGVDLNDG